MNKIGANKKLIAMLVLVATFAIVLGLLIPYFALRVDAVKTSDLWITGDWVKSNESGELSLENKKSGKATFRNKIYANHSFDGGAKGFDIVGQITSNNYNGLKLHFMSKPGLNDTVGGEIQTTINLKKVNGKMAVVFKDGSFYSPKEVTSEKQTSVNFENAYFKMFYNSVNNKFEVKVTTDSTFATVNETITLDVENEISENVTMSVEFLEIEENSKATAKITSINEQSLIETNGAIVETKSLDVVDNSSRFKTETESSKNVLIVGEKTIVKLPIAYYGVLNSDFKKTIKVEYSSTLDGTYADIETDAKINTTNMSFYSAKGVGYYKVTATLKESGKDDVKNETSYIFKAVVDNQKPTLDYSATYADAYKKETYAVGKDFQIVAPKVSDSLGIDNQYNVKYYLYYKSPSDADWKQTTSYDLKFSPSSVGTYKFAIRAEDGSGNVDNSTDLDANYFEVNFTDIIPPIWEITAFPDKVYLNETVNLPSGSIKSFETNPFKEIKAYKGNFNKDTIANATKENEIKMDYNSFEVKATGEYTIVYTAVANGMKVVEFRYFTVNEDVRPVGNVSSWTDQFANPWTITFMVIGGLALIAIVVIVIMKVKSDKAKK